jgi:hypothetical protein
MYIGAEVVAIHGVPERLVIRQSYGYDAGYLQQRRFDFSQFPFGILCFDPSLMVRSYFNPKHEQVLGREP